MEEYNRYIFVPNLYSNLDVKFVFEATTCTSKLSRSELWVNSESRGNHKIAREITVN